MLAKSSSLSSTARSPSRTTSQRRFAPCLRARSTSGAIWSALAVALVLQVLKMERGQFFGEVALIRNVPRTANVTASGTTVRCLTLERASFGRLFGEANIKVRLLGVGRLDRVH